MTLKQHLSIEHFSTTKYGKLRMAEPICTSIGSHKRVVWICDCGKTTTAEICKVINGNTKSCGKCNLLSKEYLATAKFGKLRLKLTRDLYAGSREKLVWLCDCGSEVINQALYVITLKTARSCGHCSDLSAEHFKNTKYGRLRMETPIKSAPMSKKHVVWLCDCGNKINRSIQLVTSGHTSSCGKCRHSDPEYWVKDSYGYLKSDEVKGHSCGSNKKMKWICNCGNETFQEIHAVTSGKVKSCGHCMTKAINWYQENEQLIRQLRCPINPDNIPSGWISSLEVIEKTEEPFRALCKICKKEYHPIWGNIRKGSSLTCGCASNHTSGASIDISSFIESLGLSVELEYEVDGLSYDIFVPLANLLIEYNGLRWHSEKESKERDIRKYKNALTHDYLFLSIFEDEWLYNKEKVKNLLKNKLTKSKPISLRPSKVEIKIVSSDLANPFYDQFHYIGRCNAKVHYGVFYQDRLIGAMSFSHPTRQHIKHPFELIRMASDPEFRVHGIWSKILKLFIEEFKPSSIVSFSDNRLFSGGVYEKIGFKLDGEIRPDYYWVKGNRRYHKSGLRKTKEERLTGLTETVLRENQGYRKIWDLGKKRWVLKVT